MSRVLHLLKGDHAALMLDVLAQQQAAGDDVTVALLPGAPPLPAAPLPAGVTVLHVPDGVAYEVLLERIFEADQVITW